MARVAVLHNTLDFQGGADAVCLETCRALQADHDVTLFTISQTNLSDLADRFEVDLGNVEVRMPPGASTIAETLSVLAPWIGPQLAFRSVLLQRYVRSWLSRFDLAVSTANELSLPIPSVQYIHFPQFNGHRLSHDAGDSGWLNRLWSGLGGPSPGSGDSLEGSNTLLANSAFTAATVESLYGSCPAVLHPPVDPIPCDGSWTDRERGVVVVSRIAPDKRLLDAIALIESVRDRDHDVHLHIAGSAPRAYRRYADRVTAASGERPFVTLELDVSRERIEELLCTHRVGLNLKEQEPFGMAVAEYLAAGMVPLAPAGGGQQEILRDRSDLTFDSLAAAADLVIQATDRDSPPSLQRDRFAVGRFRDRIREHVERALGSADR